MESSTRPVVCAQCGTPAPTPASTLAPTSAPTGATPDESSAGPAAAPVSWMTEFDARRGTLLFGPACAREHLRSVEARLPQEWW